MTYSGTYPGTYPRTHPRFAPGTFFAPLQEGYYVGDGINGTLINGTSAAVIPLITGRLSVDEIALTLDLPKSSINRVLNHLGESGYLASPPPSPPSSLGVMALSGSKRTAQLLALNLYLAGAQDLILLDRRSVSLTDSGGALLTPDEVGLPFADAVLKRIQEIMFLSGAPTRIAADIETATLLVATESFPPEVEAEAMRSGRTHLISRTLGSAITLGPLVLPGMTGCLRCHRLRVRDEDEHLEAIERALYTARVSEDTPLPLAQLAASLQTLAILAFLREPQRPHPLHNTVLTITSTLEISSTSFAPHPRCGCTWKQAAKP